MSGRRELLRLRAAMAQALVLAACGSTTPSAAPVAAEPALACIGINPVECRLAAGRVVDAVGAGRDGPFAVLVQLFECEPGAACAQALDDRTGTATVEWADGREPVMVTLAGPSANPRIERQQVRWSGPQQPASPRALGPGPFLFDVGHCGLTWMVDFDGSFWLLTGDIDASAIDSSDNQHGEMSLVGPNRATYRSPTGLMVHLVRFPGPKHVWVCR